MPRMMMGFGDDDNANLQPTAADSNTAYVVQAGSNYDANLQPSAIASNTAYSTQAQLQSAATASGPLGIPVWGWVALGVGGAGVLLYMKSRSKRRGR